MKKRYTISTMVSAAVVLAACGGGGGTASTSNLTSASKPTVNITGTVPGTLIEAFCEDGSYHAVNSENNSSGKHPFILKIPTNLSCRLVMTTNDNDPVNKVITPIKFVSSNGTSSIVFSASDDVDLAYVDLALSRDQMYADANQDGVEDVPLEVSLDAATSEAMDVVEKETDPLDKDSDGIIDAYEDDDHDKLPNYADDDDDGDGIKDVDDDDHDDADSDGIKDQQDIDDDNNGIEDDAEDHDNDGNDNDHDNNNDGGVITNPGVVNTPSAGRLLASQCAQCHRTDANPNKGFEDLIGEEIYGDLVEMKRESKRELMHLQAKGYSDAQIRLIDDYFNNLSAKKGGE